MASLEMASKQTFDCVPSRDKKENNLKVFVRDRFNSCRVSLVEDYGSNEDGKNKEVLECSSRSSVSETGESLQIPSSSSPLETISNPFYNPVKAENPSGNMIITGASSLVQIWEARLSQSQNLINSRTSSGLSLYYNSNSSSFSEFLNDEAKKNYENSGEEIDWCSSYVSDSYEKEREGRFLLELANCSPRIRGKQASEEISKMLLRDRENELEWLLDRSAVSKFSPRGRGRLQYMLTIRSLERCIAIQERYRLKSAASDVNRSLGGPSVMNIRDKYKTNTDKGSAGNVNSAAETQSSTRMVSSQVNKVSKMANTTGDKNVLQEIVEKCIPRKTQDATYKPKIAKKPVLTEDSGNTNSLKKPRIEGSHTEEREGSRKAMEKDIVKESTVTNKSLLSIAEKANLRDSKERTNRRRTMEKAKDKGRVSRIVINKETVERKKKEVSSFEESKSMEIEEYRINPQEVTLAICLDRRKDEETGSHISRESGKEKKYSQEDGETLKAENQEALRMILESQVCLNGWDENATEDEENEDFSGESVQNDWISYVSKPQSHWKGLRKQRELEIVNKYSEKDEIWNLIERRTVSTCLASDFCEKINKILISIAQKRLEEEKTLLEEKEKEKEEEEEEITEDSLVECSARYKEKLEEDETTKDHETSSSETQMICDLREQIKQLQIEMLELKSFVKSCVDFKKSESLSDSLERNCSVCFQMPVVSLLYRCEHMCTCLKCASIG